MFNLCRIARYTIIKASDLLRLAGSGHPRNNPGRLNLDSVCEWECQILTLLAGFGKAVSEPSKHVHALEMLLFGRGPGSMCGAEHGSLPQVVIRIPAAPASTVLVVTECSFRRTALNSLRFGHEEAAVQCPLLD